MATEILWMMWLWRKMLKANCTKKLVTNILWKRRETVNEDSKTNKISELNISIETICVVHIAECSRTREMLEEVLF